MISSDDDCSDTPPRAVTISLSLSSLRRRRSRLARLPTSPSTCEESSHYPVFDPQDPRHNSALRASAWPGDAYDLPQTTYTTGSIRWMQSLPRRSIRRARSGFQALASGFHRRPVHQSADGEEVVIIGVWPPSNSPVGASDPHRRLSSAVSEASTEEDGEFGTDLYRTGYNHASAGFPSHTPRPHPAPLPTLSTGVDLCHMYPVETSSTARSEECLNAKAIDPSISSADDSFEAARNDHCRESSVIAADPEIPDRNPTSPTQVPPPSNSPMASISAEIVIPSEDSSSTDMRNSSLSRAAADKDTNMSSTSCGSSSGVSCQSQDNKAICLETQAAQLATENNAISTCMLENPRAGDTEEDIEPDSEVETAPTKQPDDVAPEIQLGDLGGVDYYLSLDTFCANNPPERNTSDEEPSPGSLSEDDANPPLSPWLPVDKGDPTSLLSLRDEFFLVDGKSTDLRPDRGDNPIKRERVFIGDGRLHRGPGLDRSLSTRTQEIPEIIGPGGPIGIPTPRMLRVDSDGSDSTDEYLVTYSLLHQHYFS